MSMRIGTVNGRLCKRVQKNSDKPSTTIVQPVKVVDGQLMNDGERFVCKSEDFKKGYPKS